MGLKTHPHAPTMNCNALRETIPSLTPKLQKPSLKTFTWTISLTQWSLLRKPSIDRRNWYIFSISVGSSLQSFSSNVPDLADRIDGSPQSTEPKVIVSCQEDSSHVLGLKWDHTNDDILVISRGTSCAITKSLTQRLVLSLVSKVFEPIGLVAPFTVGARLLLKDIWRVTGQQWDDELPQNMVQRFLVWSADLPKLENTKIPRSYFSEPFDNIELHKFGDSSQDIFSAVAFLRARVKTTTGQEKTELAFVLGKARVAPMKVMTVPKLELQLALLAARLKREITQALTVTVNQGFM